MSKNDESFHVCQTKRTVMSRLISSECSIEPADVVFVLDTSYSIWPPDFYKEVEFMEKVIQTFDVGQESNQTRIGALTFGHEVWPKFYLNTYFGKIKYISNSIRLIVF